MVHLQPSSQLAAQGSRSATMTCRLDGPTSPRWLALCSSTLSMLSRSASSMCPSHSTLMHSHTTCLCHGGKSHPIAFPCVPCVCRSNHHHPHPSVFPLLACPVLCCIGQSPDTGSPLSNGSNIGHVRAKVCSRHFWMPSEALY